MCYQPSIPGAPGTFRLLAAVALCSLYGCAPDPVSEICFTDCELEIFLPENPDVPPLVPPVIRVVEDQAITVSVSGRRPDQAQSVLVFDQPAVEDEQGRPQYSVTLLPGQTTLHLRRYEVGVCHAPAGCSYFVVNTGLAGRPVGTKAGGILIIDSAATLQ